MTADPNRQTITETIAEIFGPSSAAAAFAKPSAETIAELFRPPAAEAIAELFGSPKPLGHGDPNKKSGSR